jgi:hypothetical protein
MLRVSLKFNDDYASQRSESSLRKNMIDHFFFTVFTRTAWKLVNIVVMSIVYLTFETQ